MLHDKILIKNLNILLAFAVVLAPGCRSRQDSVGTAYSYAENASEETVNKMSAYLIEDFNLFFTNTGMQIFVNNNGLFSPTNRATYQSELNASQDKVSTQKKYYFVPRLNSESDKEWAFRLIVSEQEQASRSILEVFDWNSGKPISLGLSSIEFDGQGDVRQKMAMQKSKLSAAFYKILQKSARLSKKKSANLMLADSISDGADKAIDQLAFPVISMFIAVLVFGTAIYGHQIIVSTKSPKAKLLWLWAMAGLFVMGYFVYHKIITPLMNRGEEWASGTGQPEASEENVFGDTPEVGTPLGQPELGDVGFDGNGNVTFPDVHTNRWRRSW